MKQILLALTDRDLLRSYAELFRLLGWSVTEAFDGVQAMNALADGNSDVLLLDGNSPRMSADALLKEASARKIPAVLALPGRCYGRAADGAGGGAAPAETVVYPFSPDTLLTRIRSALGAEAADEGGNEQ